VAEAHGGRATVTSAPGEGARFTVELPLEGDDPDDQPPVPPPDGPLSTTRDAATVPSG
jgi:hypothetical protein